MDNKPAGTLAEASAPARVASGTKALRKRRNIEDANVRYFLPKPGSSPATPELGQLGVDAIVAQSVAAIRTAVATR